MCASFAVDSYEFTALPDQITIGNLLSNTTVEQAKEPFEYKPHFHEWATALPGMICVSRKARNQTFRNYVAAETATPVISCCAVLGGNDMKNFYFAGICRSASVRPIDDGVGPSVDEFFTLAIGGMATLLNNSGVSIFPGDMLEWCFYNEARGRGKKANKNDQMALIHKSRGHTRGTGSPRRITVKIATAASERVIGRALSFSKPGETFDLVRAYHYFEPKLHTLATS